VTRAMAHNAGLRLICDNGDVLPLAMDRWLGEPPTEEEVVLGEVAGPVLDIGCGPGRHVSALAARGVPSLGIDTSAEAVHIASARGAAVIHRSIFDRVPALGRWATALLLDGNIGIGGDPVALLERVRELLAPRGCAVIEAEGPGVGCRRGRARLQVHDRCTEWFPWARVGLDALHDIALHAGFSPCRVVTGGGRWFATLIAR
jgi:SAM-dependent methyltransferase